MIFDITGDCCYLSLIDPLRYKSFVGKDWDQHHRLLEPHFIAEGQKQCALVWDTGFEANWRVEVKEGRTSKKGFREMSGTILNSGDGIYLANYDSLSMAAQFADHKLPDKNCKNYKIKLPAGLYTFRIVEWVDPDIYFDSCASEKLDRAPEFLLEYQKTDKAVAPWKNVPWSLILDDA